MGTNIALEDQRFFLPADRKAEARERARVLWEEPFFSRTARGGTYEPSGRPVLWYAWTSTERCKAAETIEELLAEFRFEPTLDNEGNITALTFTGEKLGQEELLFDAIAPCVRPGSYLEVEGDGGRWRWVFNGLSCREIQPVVEWPSHDAGWPDDELRKAEQTP